MVLVIMSTEQQIPGISDTSNQTEEVVEHPVEDNATWISRHSRSLWGVGVVGVAVILGVTLRSLFRRKN
jgi:cell division protein FtsX